MLQAYVFFLHLEFYFYLQKFNLIFKISNLSSIINIIKINRGNIEIEAKRMNYYIIVCLILMF